MPAAAPRADGPDACGREDAASGLIGSRRGRNRRCRWRRVWSPGLRDEPHVDQDLLNQMPAEPGLASQRTDAEDRPWRKRGQAVVHLRPRLVAGASWTSGPRGVRRERLEAAVSEAVAPQPDRRLTDREHLRCAMHRVSGRELQDDSAPPHDPCGRPWRGHPADQLLALVVADDDLDSWCGRHWRGSLPLRRWAPDRSAGTVAWTPIRVHAALSSHTRRPQRDDDTAVS